ncbi:hypothetical protein M413DRAFT_448577 [Hebeloma cylindrosporum]|uniref:Uncharacterized protein n=1 Tax=Hebeloma cylindrosporum TaxID=76867 RepID=A0A0C3BZ01_HEBCY|nr:hypothetical protein M413DRAFT_448577 [Hebeloma cylindrosporum h7]
MWREPVYSKEYLENAPKTSQGTPFGSVLFHDPPPAEYCAPPPQPGMNLEEFFPATESPELADSDYLSEEMANDPSRSNASVDHRYESPDNIDHSMGTHHVQGLTPAQYSSSHKNGYDQTFTERHTYPPTIVPHGQYHHERHAGAYPNQQAIEHLPRPPLSGPNAAGQSGRWYWIPDDAASVRSLSNLD